MSLRSSRLYRALSLAVAVGYLASCQAQPITNTPSSTVNPVAPPQAQSALKYTDPSAQAPKGLSYNTKVVGAVPRGARIKLEPEFKDGKVVGIKKSSFRVLQEAEECPPALPEIETTVQPYTQNGDDQCTLTTSGYSYYVIFDNSSYMPNSIIYQTWTHSDQVWECSSGAYNQISYESQAAFEGSCTISQGPSPSPTPSPSPSPEETPEPPTPEPTEPPSTPPPTIPPTAPPTEPPTPEPTPTPTPDPTLTLDHAVISPDGDGFEDTSPAHVEATGGWKVEVSGGALTQPLQVAGGSDDGSFTWTGKAGNTVLPDGNYTLTLTELGTGKTVQVPALLKTPLEIKAQYEAFSPNLDPETDKGDGRFDYNEISVRCRGKWSITADGVVIKTGEGNTADKPFVWDGKPEIGRDVLADKRYELILTRLSDNETVRVPVILDTSPPTVKLSIDKVEFPDIVNNQLPTFEALLNDDLAGVNDIDAVVRFEFTKRQDGVIPTIDEEAKDFDRQTSTFQYKTPPKEECLLYGGDQFVILEVEDKAGNRLEVKRGFAVGGHTLWAGVPDLVNAYRVSNYSTLQATTDVPKPVEQYMNDPKFRVMRLDPDKVYGPEMPREQANPISENGGAPRIFPNPKAVGGWASLFLVVNEITRDSRYFHIDEEYDSIVAVVRRGKPKTFKVGTIYDPFGNPLHVGDITIDNETYDHVGPERGHTEVGPNSLAMAIQMLRTRGIYDGQFELWLSGQRGFPTFDKMFLVMKWQGNLYSTVFKVRNKSGYFVRTQYGAARHPGDTLWRPAVYQWSYIVSNVSEFYEATKANIKKYRDTDKVVSELFGVTVDKPEYGYWFKGHIPDDTVKPYTINLTMRRADANPKRAIPRLNKKEVPGR